MSQPPPLVDLYRGNPSAYDVLFSGGKKIVRPTMAVGNLPDGRRVEVGLRRDFRKDEEVCFVFHVLYV